MELIEQIGFKYNLTKKLKKGYNLDMLFLDPDFPIQMSAFIHGKIGKIWLKSPAGRYYQRWQKGEV